MDLRTRLGGFLASENVTHHGPAGHSPTPARTRTRAAMVLAAALGTSACATHGVDPVDAPPRSFSLPEIAGAAAANSGIAVSYVEPERDNHYLDDVNANRVAPDGSPAEGKVNSGHLGSLMLARQGGSSPQALYSSDATYGHTCTAIIADPSKTNPLPLFKGATFENPDTPERFTTLHELGGHCAYKPEESASNKGVTHVRHTLESQADSVAVALLAAEQGDTRDARKIADLRSVWVAKDAHQTVVKSAGNAMTRYNSASYMTAPAVDATLDWAESRLDRPPNDPGHLSNMPPREIIQHATQTALDNTLSPGQLTRLNRHLRSHLPQKGDVEPKSDFRSVPAPRDPAIKPAFERIDMAHGRLYGEAARSTVVSAPAPKRQPTRAGAELGD